MTDTDSSSDLVVPSAARGMGRIHSHGTAVTFVLQALDGSRRWEEAREAFHEPELESKLRLHWPASLAFLSGLWSDLPDQERGQGIMAIWSEVRYFPAEQWLPMLECLLAWNAVAAFSQEVLSDLESVTIGGLPTQERVVARLSVEAHAWDPPRVLALARLAIRAGQQGTAGRLLALAAWHGWGEPSVSESVRSHLAASPDCQVSVAEGLGALLNSPDLSSDLMLSRWRAILAWPWSSKPVVERLRSLLIASIVRRLDGKLRAYADSEERELQQRERSLDALRQRLSDLYPAVLLAAAADLAEHAPSDLLGRLGSRLRLRGMLPEAEALQEAIMQRAGGLWIAGLESDTWNLLDQVDGMLKAAGSGRSFGESLEKRGQWQLAAQWFAAAGRWADAQRCFQSALVLETQHVDAARARVLREWAEAEMRYRGPSARCDEVIGQRLEEAARCFELCNRAEDAGACYERAAELMETPRFRLSISPAKGVSFAREVSTPVRVEVTNVGYGPAGRLTVRIGGSIVRPFPTQEFSTLRRNETRHWDTAVVPLHAGSAVRVVIGVSYRSLRTGREDRARFQFLFPVSAGEKPATPPALLRVEKFVAPGAVNNELTLHDSALSTSAQLIGGRSLIVAGVRSDGNPLAGSNPPNECASCGAPLEPGRATCPCCGGCLCPVCGFVLAEAALSCPRCGAEFG